jgi:hypothetical protein
MRLNVFLPIAVSVVLGCVIGGRSFEGRACNPDHPCPDPLFCFQGSCRSTLPEDVELPANNVVVNPSFEGDDSGWNNYQALTSRVAREDAPHGDYVLEVSWRMGTEFTIDDYGNSVLSSVGGATYEATAYVAAASATSVGKVVKLYVRERTQAEVLIPGGVASQGIILTNGFQKVTTQRVASASGNLIDVYVGMIGAGSGDAFWVDAVTLVH